MGIPPTGRESPIPPPMESQKNDPMELAKKFEDGLNEFVASIRNIVETPSFVDNQDYLHTVANLIKELGQLSTQTKEL